MSQNRNETDALAETQLIPAIPAQGAEPPRSEPARAEAARKQTLSALLAPWATDAEETGDPESAADAQGSAAAVETESESAAQEVAEPETPAGRGTNGSRAGIGAHRRNGSPPAAISAAAAPVSAPASDEASQSTNRGTGTTPSASVPAASGADSAASSASATAASPSAHRPRIHLAPGFIAPELAAQEAPASAPESEDPPPRVRSRRASIPVPPEFLDSGASPRTSAARSSATADPETEAKGGDSALAPQPPAPAETKPEAKTAAASPSAPPAATPAAKPAAPPSGKPDDGGFSSGPPRWQESVPFDETGVLMRPEALRAKAMRDETELISAIKVDDGSEAALAQRPGFWTGAWPRRALLTAILLLQAILTLRNNNSAFEDEALYLYSGHLELGHLLYGTSIYTNFWTYFSGAPTLYPVIGAIADQLGGLFAARLLSLGLMLGTTALLYLISRRLFGTRAAFCAAALYSCCEATVFVGGLATYDAPALFLLALSTWIVVRFAKTSWPLYLLAVFPASLAVGTKYAALMFLPVIALIALLAAAPYAGKLALLRPVALGIGFAIVIWSLLKIAGPTAIQGVQQTTTARAQGTNTIESVLQNSGEWGGVLFGASLLGAVFLIVLPRAHVHAALPAARWQRVLLAGLLAGTALLPVAYQAYLHTLTSLHKHVAFGVFFAAPLAGYGLVRLVGPHFHRVQIGIGVVVLAFALGMGQSLTLFHGWPNSNTMVNELVRYQKPNANYLVEADSVAIYALRGDPDAQPTQFTDTFYFAYTTAQGKALTGDDAYAAAIQAGYFQVVVYDGLDNAPVDQAIAAMMYRAPNYKLVATISAPTGYGPAYYYFWVKK